MIKFVELIPPRKDISLQVFHDHWRHPHGSLGRNINQLRRYIQNHRIESPALRTDPVPFQGVAEGWFDSLEECMALGTSPYMSDHVIPDEERFIDRSGVKIFFVAEEVISSGPHSGQSFRAKTEISDYDLLWSDNHRAVAIKLLQFIEADGASPWAADNDAELGHRLGAFRHVRSRAVTAPSVYMGVRELWWPTLTAFERGISADPGAWTELRDRPKSSFSLLCQAERVI